MVRPRTNLTRTKTAANEGTMDRKIMKNWYGRVRGGFLKNERTFAPGLVEGAGLGICHGWIMLLRTEQMPDGSKLMPRADGQLLHSAVSPDHLPDSWSPLHPRPYTNRVNVPGVNRRGLCGVCGLAAIVLGEWWQGQHRTPRNTSEHGSA